MTPESKPTNATTASALRGEYGRMALWKRASIYAAIFLIVAGVIMTFLASSSLVAQAAPSSGSIHLPSGIVLKGAGPTGLSDTLHRTGDLLWRTALSFCVAFVAGFMFRHFVKGIATAAAFVVVGAVALQLIFGVDLASQVRGNVEASGPRLVAMGREAMQAFTAHIPAGISVIAGFVIGFLRR
jgi:hypothetical protein